MRCGDSGEVQEEGVRLGVTQQAGARDDVDALAVDQELATFESFLDESGRPGHSTRGGVVGPVAEFESFQPPVGERQGGDGGGGTSGPSPAATLGMGPVEEPAAAVGVVDEQRHHAEQLIGLIDECEGAVPLPEAVDVALRAGQVADITLPGHVRLGEGLQHPGRVRGPQGAEAWFGHHVPILPHRVPGHHRRRIHHMMKNQCAVVETTALTVARGRVTVLHDLDLALERGSITGLIGPSGCGKTTLMRTLMGVQRITSGEARVLGLPVGHPELRRRVAYTSQAVSIYGDATVLANVHYFARLVGAGRDAAARAIERVRLSGHEGHRVDRLSGGQASRASLACALVGDPEVLILDEPTVGLDPLTREALWTLFRELADAGTTLLVSSHVMDEARRCDAVLFMRDGRFLAHEPIARLQERTGTSSPEAAFLALIEEAA